MADCNPITLIEDAFCLTCTIPRDMWPAVKLALLCSIATGGGGGGTGGVLSGVGAPAGAPANASTLYYEPTTGALWMWSGSAWVNLIAA
jgi:hypothetical protein